MLGIGDAPTPFRLTLSIDRLKPSEGRKAVPPDQSSVSWRLRSVEPLQVARFGDEAVVFNPVSWQTHLLNSTALDALKELEIGPRTVTELVHALFEFDEEKEAVARAENVEHADEMIQSLLEELRELGFAEPERSADATG